MSATALKPVHIPGPDHPITVTPNDSRVVVKFASRTIADTTRALTLTEASYKPVQYIPREDVEMALLTLSKRSSYCPFKGEATYYNITIGDKLAEAAIWSYEEAYDSVSEITGYLAFYPDMVDSIEELDA